jgi:signal transduction histidine kinase
MILVLISIPVSLFSIRAILNDEVDESLSAHADQFLKHVKGFEYLDDLETDLQVLDQLSYNIHITSYTGDVINNYYETVNQFDSVENEERPVRQISSTVDIKGKPYMLTVQMSLVDNNELITAIGLVQVTLVVLLASGLLLLNRSLSKKLWKPFYNTLNQLKAYDLDKNESIKADKTDIVEFDDLNKTVIHLTDRNRKVFLQQKEFIENASHELQTPIAIFQSKLDILMQNPFLSETEADTIMELEASAQRMARLNKNLLFLSKIDNEQFNDKEEIELSVLINDLLDNIKQLVTQDVTITATVAPIRIKANKTLIEVLLTNLFHNAIRHASLHRTVTVQLIGRTLKISNSGNPLKMDPEKMFARFAKEGTSEDSTGLGLAIVKKICESCSYSIEYQYENSAHIFSVTL